jgi:hypothetical protein
MRQKRRLIYLAFAIAGLFSLAILTNRAALNHRGSHRVGRVSEDAMDLRSRSLVGADGIDCGRVKVNGDPKMATDCALKAESEGRPFRVRYDIQGIDSEVAGGVVRTPSGDLYGLWFDREVREVGVGHSSEDPCPKPYHLWVNPKGRVNCYQQQLSYPKNAMSPNLEPY